MGYMIVDQTFDDNGVVSNVNRHVYIFPPCVVKRGDVVRLYTREGRDSSFEGNYGREEVMYHNFFWGFEAGCTVWNVDGDTPYLLHYDSCLPELF